MLRNLTKDACMLKPRCFVAMQLQLPCVVRSDWGLGPLSCESRTLLGLFDQKTLPFRGWSVLGHTLCKPSLCIKSDYEAQFAFRGLEKPQMAPLLLSSNCPQLNFNSPWLSQILNWAFPRTAMRQPQKMKQAEHGGGFRTS